MRKIAVAAFVPVLALGACGRGASGSAGEWPADRTFYSTSVTDAAGPRPLVPGTRIELRFFADGRLSAQAGCNHLGGSGRIDGGTLVLGDLSMTEMGCDEPRAAQDMWLSAFLGSRPTWSLVGDDLRLRGGEVEIRLADRRNVDPDRPLAGTRWVVDTVITGDAASSVPSGVEAYLEFDGRGTFTGHTGCADIEGRVTAAGAALEFTSVTGLQATCTGAPASMHTAVTGVVTGQVSYAIEGPHLTLTAAGGDGLRLRAAR